MPLKKPTGHIVRSMQTGAAPTTKLSDSNYRVALKAALSLLDAGERLTNTSLRRSTGLGYDQAIAFFNRAISDGNLHRLGRSSATHYVRTMSAKRL